MVSTATNTQIEWCMKYYDQEGLWARPHTRMCCHIFNLGPPFRVPRMVTSPKLIALALGTPLHSYYRALLEWFDIAPMQLSPNIYKLSVTLIVLYTDLGFDPPFTTELSYLFSLYASNIGYYYVVVWKPLFGKGFSEGRVSNTKGWKEPYFYIYDIPHVRT